MREVGQGTGAKWAAAGLFLASKRRGLGCCYSWGVKLEVVKGIMETCQLPPWPLASTQSLLATRDCDGVWSLALATVPSTLGVTLGFWGGKPSGSWYPG